MFYEDLKERYVAILRKLTCPLGWSVALGIISVFALSGCIDQSGDTVAALYQDSEMQSSQPQRRQATGKPLSAAKLASMLREAIYTGSPEKFGNVVMHDTKGMAPVVFPHWAHRSFYSCQVCHSELEFSMLPGGSEISCDDNRAGRYCGACHDGQTSFTVKDGKPRNCNRCHRDVNSAEAMSSLTENFKELANRLPKAEYGDGIDWGRALNEGYIKPEKSLYNDQLPDMPTEHIKKPLQWDTAAPKVSVVFSHPAHLGWLECSNCHPGVFNIRKLGTVAFDKKKNLEGMFCGTCHLRVAFPINNCSRCHPGVDDWAN